jgi:hypothetical protein
MNLNSNDCLIMNFIEYELKAIWINKVKKHAPTQHYNAPLFLFLLAKLTV